MPGPIREPVPPLVRMLIDRCLPSMEHVELLLWLASDEKAMRRLHEAAATIHAGADLAAKRLLDLEEAGLVERDSETKAYRYAPRTMELRNAVGELDTMYNQRPVTLVRAIYERPVSPVRSFADAFRLRSDE